MLVLNICLFLGIEPGYGMVPAVFAGAYLLGILSWTFVEKPSMALKNRFRASAQQRVAQAAVLD